MDPWEPQATQWRRYWAITVIAHLTKHRTFPKPQSIISFPWKAFLCCLKKKSKEWLQTIHYRAKVMYWFFLLSEYLKVVKYERNLFHSLIFQSNISICGKIHSLAVLVIWIIYPVYSSAVQYIWATYIIQNFLLTIVKM